MQERDFSARTSFPGSTGNPFDRALHRALVLQQIPAVPFALLLFLIAFLVFQTRWLWTAGLFAFFCLDWILIATLPKAGKSFGPSHPTVLALAVLRALVALLPAAIAIPLQIVGILLVVYGFWIEPHTLRVTRQALVSSQVPPGQSFTLLHLGDLHLERITRREKQLNRLIQELKPDLILFSGDFINLSYLKDPQAWASVRSLLQEWSAPYGVYAVTGSPAVDLEEIVPILLDGMPIHHLSANVATVDVHGIPVNLVGLDCSHRPFVDGPRLRALTAHLPGHLTILLYHSPDLAPVAATCGIDLQLSGHTHGGQVRLPILGALFTGSLYGRLFDAGRMAIGPMVLYISRGIGMEGAAAPRVRFLCPPEIILWTVAGKES